MEENPRRKEGARREAARRKRRDVMYDVGDESGEEGERRRGKEGDLMECSGKYCQSCTAALIADCVALCCCPCALVNILTLAFVKVPWMVGRKWLEKKKKKKKRKGNRSSGDHDSEAESRIGNLMNGRAELGTLEIGFGGEEEGEEMARVSAKSEAERVWLELYQVGHLGFGRVSFTGIQ